MPRCVASSPRWCARVASIVGLPNQIAIFTSNYTGWRRHRHALLAVFFADAPVRFAERDAFARYQRVGLFGGMDRGIEFDAGGAETHALDAERHDGGGREREVDATEQRRLDELQITLITRRQLREYPQNLDQACLRYRRAAAHQLEDVGIALLRHDRRAGGEAVGQRHEREF